jgi:hypothetical protein
VRYYGSILSAKLCRIYDEPWPQYPVRVDGGCVWRIGPAHTQQWLATQIATAQKKAKDLRAGCASSE